MMDHFRDAPLAVVTRGPYMESAHRGLLAIANLSTSTMISLGAADSYVCLRSVAKPFQAIEVIASGAAEHFGITDPELAIICGSHGGTEEHVRVVVSILDKLGLCESDLRCGSGRPLDQGAAELLIRDGCVPSQLHSDCSGKHAGMLATCLHLGLPLSGYTDYDHPLQRRILDRISKIAEIPVERINVVADGCGAPTYLMPLHHVAIAYAKLGGGLHDKTLAASIHRLVTAMTTYPELVAGKGRHATTIMKLLPGRLLAKDGAEGMHAVSIMSRSIGIVVKISDGSNRPILPVLAETLIQLGGIDVQHSGCIDEMRQRILRTRDGREVGVIAPVFRLPRPTTIGD
jgi:L-asparaginase II